MIEVKNKRTCAKCGYDEIPNNVLHQIYTLKIGENNIPLCSACLLNVKEQVDELVDSLYDNIPNTKETDYDDEVFPKLQILLNCRISGEWNEQYQSELDKLDQEKMCNANRLLYRQISEW